MRILIVGSGGREHAIARAFAMSGRVSKIYCASGNAGIAELAELVPIDPTEVERLADLAAENEIDLTFVGGETALALGIADVFRDRGLKIVGPGKDAARLEASKAFAKEFMQRHSIPTASFLTCSSIAEAEDALTSGEFGGADSPVVVKADGLAAGKGVVVAADRDAGIEAVRGLASLAGAEAASTVVLEECLIGREVSLMMFCDGKDFALMPATRDHKRLLDNDEGPNTGGMGAITDDSLLTDELRERVVKEIIEPTLAGCAAEGFPFSGVLFLGLMITADGPKLLEYNVRFGDPETQAILVRLNSDFVELCEAILNQRLAEFPVEWSHRSSACVILAAEGYPAKPVTGDVIEGLEDAAMKDIVIFHSGTKQEGSGQFVTAGGRVIGVTSLGEDVETAVAWAYHAAEKISWRGMQRRSDIGK
jgi:phosphoribosylamine--glycine ligase